MDQLEAQMMTLGTQAEACVPDSTAVVTPQHGTVASSSVGEPAKAGTVGIVYDAVMELHMREGHPEHPNRVRQLNDKLKADGLLERCHRLTPKLATDEELLTCHGREHIARVENLYMNPVKDDGQPAEKEGDTYIISGDIYCNQHTSTAARSAAGCAVQAVRAVMTGEVSTAFAVVRPPGHHAESNELMGFCFYNNVAVAAHAALQQPGVDRVLVLDWDIHHGNGTQQIFDNDQRVLFVSLHRRDEGFYPVGCGFATEVGKDAGTGYTVNIPWISKGMADADYLAAYDLILDPIISQFDPQLVLVSAGFDATDGDFLGKCYVTPAGFAALTQRLMKHAGGKLVAVLEGGYVPELVGNCASAVLKVLLGDTPPALCTKRSFTLHKTTEQVLNTVFAVQRQHWSQLAALPAVAARYAEYSMSLKMQWLSLNRTPSPEPVSLTAAAAARMTRSAARAAAVAGGADVKPAPATAGPAAGRKRTAKKATVAAAAEPADLAELLGGLSIQEGGQPAAAAAPPPAAAAAAETAAGGIQSLPVAEPAANSAEPSRVLNAQGRLPDVLSVPRAAASGSASADDEGLTALLGALSIFQQPMANSGLTPAAEAGTAAEATAEGRAVQESAAVGLEAAAVPARPSATVPPAVVAAGGKRINIKRTTARQAPTSAPPAAAIEPDAATAAVFTPAQPAGAEHSEPSLPTSGSWSSAAVLGHLAACTAVPIASSTAQGLMSVATDVAGARDLSLEHSRPALPLEAAAVAAVKRKINIKKTAGKDPAAAVEVLAAEQPITPTVEEALASTPPRQQLYQAPSTAGVSPESPAFHTRSPAAALTRPSPAPVPAAESTHAACVDDASSLPTSSPSAESAPVSGPSVYAGADMEAPSMFIDKGSGFGQWLSRLIRSADDKEPQHQQQVIDAAAVALPSDDYE